MTIKEAVNTCFSKYADFSGRAPRVEFWKFVLFIFLVSVLLTIINSMIFGPTVSQEIVVSVDQAGQQSQTLHTQYQYTSGWLGVVFSILVLLPSISVSVRRLHDISKSGWFVLTPFIVSGLALGVIFATSQAVPIDRTGIPEGIDFPETIRVPGSVSAFLASWVLAAGSFILLLVWLCKRSDPNTNKFGPNPNEVPS